MKRITAMPLLSVKGLPGGSAAYPYPVGREGASFWFNARAAIWQGVRTLGLREGDRVLAPAYCCGSEVDALLKATLVLDYYRILPDLSPDLDHVASLCRAPARALYVTHYFGFPQRMDEIAAFARERGLLVVEDNAHGLYSTDPAGRPLGSFGDMAVFSLWKTLPLPDGGMLMVNPGRGGGSALPAGRRPRMLPVAGKIRHLAEEALIHRFPSLTFVRDKVSTPAAAWLKAALRDAGPAADDGDAGDPEMGKIEMVRERADWRMSRVSRILLKGVCREGIRETRRRNYAALQSGIEDGKRVVPLMERLPDGCCPVFFPVLAEESKAFCRFLKSRGIGFYRIWCIHHKAIPWRDFPFESRLKHDVVVLPVHQDMGEADAAYVAQAVNDWNANRPRPAPHPPGTDVAAT